MGKEDYSGDYRFVVQNWVCDYGVWDTETNEFIGNPINSRNEAIFAVNYCNLVYQLLKKQNS